MSNASTITFEDIFGYNLDDWFKR